MTWWKKRDSKEFEFTAYTEEELFGSDGPTHGERLTLSGTPSACFTVTDDDHYLNDEKWGRDQSEDQSLQTADITIGGAQVSDDAKIFINGYVSVMDVHTHRWYKLMEISVEGSHDAYYTFKGHVPPAHAELKVSHVSGHGFDVDYSWLGAGRAWKLDPDCAYHVEAEDLDLRGFEKSHFSEASGGEVIKTHKHMATASFVFGGETGTYDLDLDVLDEDDGQGTVEIFVNGTSVGIFTLDLDNGGNGTIHEFKKSDGFRTLEIDGLDLSRGDKVEIVGTRDRHEYLRIDKLSLTQQKNEAPDALDDVETLVPGVDLLISLLANDSDPDGDTLTIIDASDGIVVGGGDADLTSAGGRAVVISVAPSGDPDTLVISTETDFADLGEGDSDAVTFTYTISDGNGGTDTATVTLNIDGENDDPVITSPKQITASDDDPADGQAIAQITASDVDLGDTIVFSITDNPGDDSAAFDIDAATGVISFNAGGFTIPDADDDGLYEFAVVATDSFGGTDTLEVELSF